MLGRGKVDAFYSTMYMNELGVRRVHRMGYSFLPNNS
jgi:hypothetical protein